jgi:glutamate dehydrogenase (NADP+)
MELKNIKRARISDYIEKYPKAKFFAGKTPWEVACEVALPCATQNELNEKDAALLISNGCVCVG